MYIIILLACAFVAILLVVAVYVALTQIKLSKFQEQLLNLPLQISKLKEDAVAKVLAAENYVRTYTMTLDVDVMRRVASNDELRNALVTLVDRSTVGLYLTYKGQVVKAEVASKAFSRAAVEFLIFRRSSSSSRLNDLESSQKRRRVHTLLVGNTRYHLLDFFTDLSNLTAARDALPLADVHVVPVVRLAMSSFGFETAEERSLYELPSSALASVAASSFSSFASLADLVKVVPRSNGATMPISALGGAF